MADFFRQVKITNKNVEDSMAHFSTGFYAIILQFNGSVVQGFSSLSKLTGVRDVCAFRAERAKK